MEEAPESRAEPEAVLSIAGIREAAARISPYVHRTPVLTCGALDEMSGGRQVFFKCELFQKTGSFKARGACNTVLLAPSECQDVVTHSSGNHAQVQYIVQYYQIQIAHARNGRGCRQIEAVKGDSSIALGGALRNFHG